jgi:hypothetical protein
MEVKTKGESKHVCMVSQVPAMDITFDLTARRGVKSNENLERGSGKECESR